MTVCGECAALTMAEAKEMTPIERLKLLTEVQEQLAAVRQEVADLIPVVEQRRVVLERIRQLALDACEHGTDLDVQAVLDITGDDIDAFIEEND